MDKPFWGDSKEYTARSATELEAHRQPLSAKRTERERLHCKRELLHRIRACRRRDSTLRVARPRGAVGKAGYSKRLLGSACAPSGSPLGRSMARTSVRGHVRDLRLTEVDRLWPVLTLKAELRCHSSRGKPVVLQIPSSR